MLIDVTEDNDKPSFKRNINPNVVTGIYKNTLYTKAKPIAVFPVILNTPRAVLHAQSKVPRLPGADGIIIPKLVTTRVNTDR